MENVAARKQNPVEEKSFAFALRIVKLVAIVKTSKSASNAR